MWGEGEQAIPLSRRWPFYMGCAIVKLMQAPISFAEACVPFLTPLGWGIIGMGSA